MNRVDSTKALRRGLHFESVAEALADAERLAESETTTTGNYSFGQILEHLARTLDIATGHTPGVKIPFPMRWMATLMRSFVVSRPLKPGFKLPAKSHDIFWPTENVSVDDGMRHFRESVDRFIQTKPLPKHPVFGNMSQQQHQQLQCRHCELHLSFVHPRTEE